MLKTFTPSISDPYYHAATNEDEAVLNELAKDKLWVVRAKVASNSNCSADLLRTLSTDENAWVRREVAGNSSTTPEVLVALTADADREVRLDLARRFHAPVSLLCLLWCDPNADVRENIRLRVSQEQFDAWKQEVMADLVGVPDDLFISLARTL